MPFNIAAWLLLFSILLSLTLTLIMLSNKSANLCMLLLMFTLKPSNESCDFLRALLAMVSVYFHIPFHIYLIMMILTGLVVQILDAQLWAIISS